MYNSVFDSEVLKVFKRDIARHLNVDLANVPAIEVVADNRLPNLFELPQAKTIYIPQSLLDNLNDGKDSVSSLKALTAFVVALATIKPEKAKDAIDATAVTLRKDVLGGGVGAVIGTGVGVALTSDDYATRRDVLTGAAVGAGVGATAGVFGYRGFNTLEKPKFEIFQDVQRTAFTAYGNGSVAERNEFIQLWNRVSLWQEQFHGEKPLGRFWDYSTDLRNHAKLMDPVLVTAKDKSAAR